MNIGVFKPQGIAVGQCAGCDKDFLRFYCLFPSGEQVLNSQGFLAAAFFCGHRLAVCHHGYPVVFKTVLDKLADFLLFGRQDSRLHFNNRNLCAERRKNMRKLGAHRARAKNYKAVPRLFGKFLSKKGFGCQIPRTVKIFNRRDK